jgi:polar amino acid transport system substrate-binding protein
MMKKLLLCTLALVFVLSVFAGCSSAPQPSASSSAVASTSAAAADTSLQKVKDAGKFILGFDDTFMPMGFKDKDGTYVGFDIDMAKEFCKKLNVELVLLPIDWDTKEMELNAGKIDCIWNGFTITDENKQKLSFGTPYLDDRQVLVVKSGSAIKTLKDLAGKKVMVQESSAAFNAISKNTTLKDSLGELLQTTDYLKALTELESGTVDCVGVDEVMVRYYIASESKQFTVLDENLGSEQYGVGFRQADKALTDEWNKFYEEVKKDGTGAKISEKWFGANILL